jgi:hypothetical protein
VVEVASEIDARNTVAQVTTTFDARIQMGRQRGLRAKVQDHLLSILDAGKEIRKFPGGHVQQDALLITRVNDYEVRYTVDLDNDAVHVVSVAAIPVGIRPDMKTG